jgi:hypothetical protein
VSIIGIVFAFANFYRTRIRTLRAKERELLLHREEAETAPRVFAVTTPFHELSVKNGYLFDYMVLEITAADRYGGNIVPERGQRREKEILHPQTTLISTAHVGARITLDGRTTSNGKGALEGMLGDGKVERFPEHFTTVYASGRRGVLGTDGDSGTPGVDEETDETPGYMFGAGSTDEIPHEVSWFTCTTENLERIEALWDTKFVLATDTKHPGR